MAIAIDSRLTPRGLLSAVENLLEHSARKIRAVEKTWDPARGTPVFTEAGRYTTRGWTEWTQGFRFGSAILQFDATGEREFLDIGREGTRCHMAVHVSHIGVHDHGFNNVSTYGNLLRLMHEGRIPEDPAERDWLELALKVSGAVQASRWTPIDNGEGFIHSFNGPHSLFVDTIRSLRSLAVAHLLGHQLMGENDEPVPLLQRLVQHARTTAHRSICYGEGRDRWDVRGRTVHECIFNVTDGRFRCPGTQQGYSPFTTWTRGLAWALCGFAEQIQFLELIGPGAVEPFGGGEVRRFMERAALATADFYLENSCRDGIPLWDTGAPGIARMGDYLSRDASPQGPHEPVDSSAAVIAAQGLLRLGTLLGEERGHRYRQAGLTIARTLFSEPYLSTDERHQGLILHSIYHLPNGWDHVPPGAGVPHGESSMWGDYHARELALMIGREARGEAPQNFFDGACR